MKVTKLNLQSVLPLTCSRTGTCCHGKLVLLNPWELVCLAKGKKMTPKEFRDLYCDFGGISLKFNGKPGWKKLPACNLYVENFGCSVHLGRPLACRMYPLGRQIQNNQVSYMYKRDTFPCLEGCPEVIDLPNLTVGEYLKGQEIDKFEQAQDAYLELMQDIADIAFELLLDTGLAESGDKTTLPLWRKRGSELPEVLVENIGQEWIDYLLIPEISGNNENPIEFTQKHKEFLLLKIQDKFGSLQTKKEIHEASVFIISMALHLARGIGADPEIIAEHWIKTAKEHGAQE